MSEAYVNRRWRLAPCRSMCRHRNYCGGAPMESSVVRHADQVEASISSVGPPANERLRQRPVRIDIERLLLRAARLGKLRAPPAAVAASNTSDADGPVWNASPAEFWAASPRRPRKVPRGRSDEEALTADIVALASNTAATAIVGLRGLAPRRGLGGESEARRADLAAGGAQGASEAAQEGAALAGRRILRPPAARASEPCLVLRLRREPDP